MKRIIKIREQLSLSQQDLAAWLHVSRASINMYELGRRSLPGEAIKRLGQMEIGYARSLETSRVHIKERKTHAAAENTTRLTTVLQKKAQDCRKRAAAMQERLEAMREQYDRLRCELTLIETNRLSITEGSPTFGKDMLWIDIQQSSVSLRAVPCSPEEQFMLQHTINLLLNEATRHEAAIGVIRSGSFDA